MTDYYRDVIQEMQEEVTQTPDDSSRLNDQQQYEDYLFQKYAWPEVSLSGNATTEPFSRKEEVDDGWGHRVVDTVHYLIIRQPVTPTDKRISDILSVNGSPHSYQNVDFEYKQGYLQQVIEAGDWSKEEKDRRVKGVIEKMLEELRRRNVDIISGNKELKEEISKIVAWKMQDAEKNRRIQENLKK
ncbi:MAG TPA: hypothetical protein VJ843_00075 [Candidatus Saccharimonadales bacterium]|nr:hypothetical protein [Candidatus Saccharimonadales bacterium]